MPLVTNGSCDGRVGRRPKMQLRLRLNLMLRRLQVNPIRSVYKANLSGGPSEDTAADAGRDVPACRGQPARGSDRSRMKRGAFER